MKFWGITGTNGKTTTAWIFAEFVNACAGRKCGYVTTVEVFDGRDRYYTGYTTPPLARLREIYAKMEANGCTDCVMEVSSHAIHQNRTGDTVFAGGAFTNLSEDHLDYHKTMAEYFRVKASFAQKIAASHPPRPDMGRKDLPPYVVCMDGGYAKEMFAAVGNFAVNAIPVSASTPTYDLGPLPLVGAYNRSNTLTAAALAEAAGVAHGTIQAAIPKLTPRWGRLERVENPKVAAEVYVDFAHTPDGLEKVLTAVRGVMDSRAANRGLQTANPAGRLWVVFGAGGDRDPMKRPLMGRACAELADRLVVTSDNPRSEDPRKIIEAVLEGVNSNLNLNLRPQPSVFVEPDRKLAIAYALANAKAGDVVVIAGKGHETTQEINGVKHPFDDREMVRGFTGGHPVAKKLAVGHFTNADFQSACAAFLPRIREVFFAWPGVVSCRPAPEFTPELRARMIADLKWARAKGLELDTLFNCNCYGEIAISHELEELARKTLGEMEAEGLFPDTVTTTSPFVAKVLRRDFPQVKIRWSVNQRVHGSTGFEYVLDDFDSFYASREHHRDREALARLSEWAHAHGKTIGIQANSGCLRQCPYQTFHDNLHGHGEMRQNEIGKRDFDFTYFLCKRTFAKPERAEDFLRATWMRPEDLPLYEPHVDIVKLATRRHPDPVGVLRAYATYSYDGDLAALTDPAHKFAKHFDNASFSSSSIWPQVRDCADANNCKHCGKCAALMKEVYR